ENGATDIANAAGTVAFALTVASATGQVFIAQYLSLFNPTAGNTAAAYDDVIQLNTASLSMVVTKTDGDGDTASASANIGNLIQFQDDGPSNILPDTAALLNVAGKSATAALDLDSNVDPNYGADGGNVQFAASLQGTNSGKTSGGLPILYDVSNGGHTLTRFLHNKRNGTFQSGTDPTVFTITLNLDGSVTTANDTYTVNMIGTVDGGSQTLSFSGVGFNFVGGNDPWAGFIDTTSAHNDLLLTPEVGGLP